LLLVPPTDAGDELAQAAQAALDLASKPATSVLAGRPQADQPVPELVAERLARLGELVNYASRGDQARRNLAAQLAGPPAGGRAGAVMGAISAWIEAPYVLADSLARRYQRRLRALSIGVYAAAATAIALGAFAAILFPFRGAWRLPVVLEAVVLAALLAVQGLDLRRICRDRWVGYRAMSEYLRIGRYLALVTPSGAPELDFNRVVRLSSWSSEPGLTPWFAPVLERLWELRPDTRLSDSDVGWLSEYLVTDWIDGQISHHASRRDTHHRWERNLRWAIGVTLLATVLAVVLHAVRDYVPRFLGAVSGRDLVSVTLAFLVIVLTSVAAAINGYAGQQRHSYHEARSRRMARELTSVRAMLHRATSIEQLRRDITEVRRVTLGEATDWFEDMRDQQIESPT
jgi:MFS family permease